MMKKKQRTDYSDQELIERRLAGILPEIELKGYPFIIDWRFKELRAKDDFAAAPIKLNRLPVDEAGLNYICHYFPDQHTGMAPDPKMASIPEGSVLLEIPYELKLDPVAVAREYGLGDRELLGSHPIQRDLKARVIPWGELGYGHLPVGPKKEGNQKRIGRRFRGGK